jgi:hypothetical protein
MNVAISLMHRLRVSQPLIGDLVERSRGRSRLWFWRQALGAIALTATRAIIERPTDALRSAAVSAGTMFVAYETMLRLYLWVSRGPFIDEFPRHSRAFLYAWHIYALPLNALWCLAAVLSGWLAVRMVAHRATFTLVVVAVQLPLVLWWGLPIAVGSVRNDLPINFALGWVFDATVILVAMPLCTLVGALL